MNLNWATGLLRTGRQFTVKHAPEILMGVGTASVGAGLYYAIKAGPRVVTVIEEAEMEKAKGLPPVIDDQGRKKYTIREPLDWREKLKATLPIYIPPIGLTLVGLGCFWGAHGIDARRQALLAVSCSTMEATLQEYQKKVIEMMGEKEHRAIKEAIAEDRSEKAEIPENSGALLPGATDIWFTIDGITFPSSYLKVKEAENNFNHQMLNQMYMSKAELYWLLDPERRWLRPKGADYHVGWSIDRMLVLRVENPFGPVAAITYEDKDGLDYPPKPGYSSGL